MPPPSATHPTPVRLVFALGILAVLGLSLSTSGGDPPDRIPPAVRYERGESTRPASEPRQIAFDSCRLPLAGGQVLEVTKAAITIRKVNTDEVLVFPFHDALAVGGVQKYAGEVSGYRVRDVRVGDIVWLGIWTEEGRKFCAEISIRKRPGGRVPESPSVTLEPSYAVRQNAANDLKDFGIPIPKHAQPKYRSPTDEELKKEREMFEQLSKDMKARDEKMEKEKRERELRKRPPPPQE